MYLSNESITVNTEMIAKIPMVMPSKERNVRNLLPFSELKANEKLSSINLIRSIFKYPDYGVKLKNLFKFAYKFFLLIFILLLVLIFQKDYSNALPDSVFYLFL